MKRLAIFDLDGTVLSQNSWQQFFWWSLRRWPSAAPALLGRLTWRKMGGCSSLRLRAAALKRLRGATLDEVAEIAQQVFESRLRQTIRSQARIEIESVRRAGFQPVLATAAFDFLVGPIAKELEISEVVASRVRSTDGVCDGTFAEPETRGARKMAALQRHFEGSEIDWVNSRAYSDDLEDAPMWSLVGDPIMVAPPTSRVVMPPQGVRLLTWRDD